MFFNIASFAHSINYSCNSLLWKSTASSTVRRTKIFADFERHTKSRPSILLFQAQTFYEKFTILRIVQTLIRQVNSLDIYQLSVLIGDFLITNFNYLAIAKWRLSGDDRETKRTDSTNSVAQSLYGGVLLVALMFTVWFKHSIQIAPIKTSTDQEKKLSRYPPVIQMRIKQFGYASGYYRNLIAFPFWWQRTPYRAIAGGQRNVRQRNRSRKIMQLDQQERKEWNQSIKSNYNHTFYLIYQLDRKLCAIVELRIWSRPNNANWKALRSTSLLISQRCYCVNFVRSKKRVEIKRPNELKKVNASGPIERLSIRVSNPTGR